MAISERSHFHNSEIEGAPTKSKGSGGNDKTPASQLGYVWTTLQTWHRNKDQNNSTIVFFRPLQQRDFKQFNLINYLLEY